MKFGGAGWGKGGCFWSVKDWGLCKVRLKPSFVYFKIKKKKFIGGVGETPSTRSLPGARTQSRDPSTWAVPCWPPGTAAAGVRCHHEDTLRC